MSTGRQGIFFVPIAKLLYNTLEKSGKIFN